MSLSQTDIGPIKDVTSPTLCVYRRGCWGDIYPDLFIPCNKDERLSYGEMSKEEMLKQNDNLSSDQILQMNTLKSAWLHTSMGSTHKEEVTGPVL